MAQGDATVYPILPISCSIVVFCFLMSTIISLVADYLYDLYLVKYSEEKQKILIQNRVKSDFTVLKNFFRANKIEKFDDEEAKKRLTIVQNLLNEKIYSKENKPFQYEIEELRAQKKKLQAEKANGKVVELNETSSSKQLIDKEKKSEEDEAKIPEKSEKNVIKKTEETNQKPLVQHIKTEFKPEKVEPKLEYKIAAKVEPKSIEKIEQKPKVEPKTVPIVVKAEPKPIDKVEPKPVATVVKAEPKPVDKVEHKTAAIPKIEPKPLEKVEQKPIQKIELKSVEEVDSKPINNNEVKPVVKVETKPLDKNETIHVVPKVEHNHSEESELKHQAKIDFKPVEVKVVSTELKQTEMAQDYSILNESKDEMNDFEEKIIETEKIKEKEIPSGIKQNAPTNLKIVNKPIEKSPLSRQPQKIQFVSKPKFVQTPAKKEAPKNITSTAKSSSESTPESKEIVHPKQVTVEEALKKLQLASRSSTVYIEIRENGVRESSARLGFEDKSFTFPKSEIDDDFEASNNANSKLSPSKPSQGAGKTTNQPVKKNNSNPFVAQNSELLETIGKKNPLNKSLTQEYREKMSQSIEEKLKLNLKNNINPKELIANKDKKNGVQRKKFKYDDDEELEDETNESAAHKEIVFT